MVLELSGRKPVGVWEGSTALTHAELPVHSVLDRLCTRAWQLVAPRFGDGLVARWPLEIDRGAPVANGIDNAVSTFSARMQ